MATGTADPPHGDAWTVAYTRYDPADEGRREVLFALGNGMYVVRAASPQAGSAPVHYPGTYRAGCYDPTEAVIDGECDRTDTLVRLPDWLPLEFRLEACPWFRLEDAQLLDYLHQLDLRGGSSVRAFTVRDAQGRRIRVREHRLVSMDDPHLCSLRLELTPLDGSGAIELRSALDGRVANANVARYADYRHTHWVAQQGAVAAPGLATLQARTRGSGVTVAMAMRTRCGAADARIDGFEQVDPGGAHVVGHAVQAQLQAGVTLWVEKTVAICSSLDPGAAEPAAAAWSLLSAAPDHAALQAAHEAQWRTLWTRAGLAVADADLSRALHLHLFHILQTASPHSVGLDCGIPARGWHGEAYHGHIFWDEAFVLPLLAWRVPEVARASLLYRWRRLDAARAAARQAGLRGAMYPWRSASDGSEATPRFQKNMLSGAWMRDHTHLQRHIGSAIAWSIWQYHLATGDQAFLCEHGAEMILEIARFWGSIARPTPGGDRYEILGVIGPDEFHNAYPGRAAPGLDNNAYTNVMAVWTLLCAQEVLAALPAPRREALLSELALGPDELALWDRISRRMVVPFFGEGLIAQYAGFEQLAEFDPSVLPPALRDERLDWALHAIGQSADAYQATKQADALTLFHLLSEDVVIAILERLGYAFDREAFVRTARYYMERTTHRSSLSRIVYAGALAQVAPPLSWDLYRQALDTDLRVLKGEQVAEGIHLAAMGGTLDTLQRRYLGLSARAEGIRLNPALPQGLGPVRLSLCYRGQSLQLESADGRVRLRSAPQNRADIAVFLPGGQWLLRPGGELSCPGRP